MNSGQHEQSPKVAPTVAIDERAEFEKWANKHKGGEPLQLGGGGTYTNPFANAAYEAWQAARKLSAPKVAPTVAIDERAEFEKSTKLSGVSIKNDTARNIDGDYYSLPVQYAWEGWQAARKLPAPEVAPTTVAEVVSKTTDTIVPDAKDEIDHDGIWTNSDVAEQRYIQGWNDCRAAMQANCDAMLKEAK